MNIVKTGATFVSVVAVAGFGWGVNAYVETRVEAVETKIAQIDEKAKGYADAAYKGAKQAHAADYWRAEVSRQERYLEHLRDTDAEGHVIRDAESELSYFRSELRAALKALSE